MPALNHFIDNRINGYDCLEEIPAFRLVTWGQDANGKIGLKLCGATDTPCGISGPMTGTVGAKFRAGDDHTFYNIRTEAEWKVEFATDCDAFAKVYTANEGRVTKTPVAGAFYLGRAVKVVRAPREAAGQPTVYDRVPIIQDAETLTKYSG